MVCLGISLYDFIIIVRGNTKITFHIIKKKKMNKKMRVKEQNCWNLKQESRRERISRVFMHF